jgi:chromosome segregation ATPase
MCASFYLTLEATDTSSESGSHDSDTTSTSASKMKALKTRSVELETRNAELEVHISNMHKDNANFASEKARLAHERSDAHKRVALLHKQQGEMANSLTRRVEEKQTLLEENATLLADNAALRTENASYLKDNLMKGRRIEQLESDLSHVKKAFLGPNGVVQDQLDEKDRRIRKLEIENKDLLKKNQMVGNDLRSVLMNPMRKDGARQKIEMLDAQHGRVTGPEDWRGRDFYAEAVVKKEPRDDRGPARIPPTGPRVDVYGRR